MKKKVIGIIGVGLICCLIGGILWKVTQPENHESTMNDQYQYETMEEEPLFSEILKNPKGSWVQGDNGFRYQCDDGAFVADTWASMDNDIYHFDKDGWMQVGWIEEDGKQYYLGTDGIMQRDVFTEDGYYLNERGILTDDQLLEGDGITYQVDDDPRDSRNEKSYWDMYYYNIMTTNYYILHEGRVFEAGKNTLTQEMLDAIDMDKVKENGIVLDYKNHKDGYEPSMRLILYDVLQKKAVVMGQYTKTEYQDEENCIGTESTREYDLETGKLIQERNDQSK